MANEYYTTDGMITNGKFYRKGGGTPEKLASFDVKVTPGGAWGSFLQAVRSRKIADCNADVELGHLSCVLVHAANNSYRLGETVPFNAKSQKLGDNHEVVETFHNLTNNLQGVGVRLEETSYQLGRMLTLDPKSERFAGAGAEKANAFLTRNTEDRSSSRRSCRSTARSYGGDKQFFDNGRRLAVWSFSPLQALGAGSLRKLKVLPVRNAEWGRG